MKELADGPGPHTAGCLLLLALRFLSCPGLLRPILPRRDRLLLDPLLLLPSLLLLLELLAFLLLQLLELLTILELLLNLLLLCDLLSPTLLYQERLLSVLGLAA